MDDNKATYLETVMDSLFSGIRKEDLFKFIEFLLAGTRHLFPQLHVASTCVSVAPKLHCTVKNYKGFGNHQKPLAVSTASAVICMQDHKRYSLETIAEWRVTIAREGWPESSWYIWRKKVLLRNYTGNCEKKLDLQSWFRHLFRWDLRPLNFSGLSLFSSRGWKSICQLCYLVLSMK